MLNNIPVTLHFGGSQINTVMRGMEHAFIIDIEGYILENPGLYQNWMISESSFKEAGNKFGFTLITPDHEIADLELTFDLPMILFGPENKTAVTLKNRLVYGADKLQVYLAIAGTSFSGQGDLCLENAFIDLSKLLAQTNQTLRSCFTCALSGYERGGNALFCMKESRTALLSESYIDGYQNWFTGMHRDYTTEIHVCDQYEFVPGRKKLFF